MRKKTQDTQRACCRSVNIIRRGKKEFLVTTNTRLSDIRRSEREDRRKKKKVQKVRKAINI